MVGEGRWGGSKIYNLVQWWGGVVIGCMKKGGLGGEAPHKKSEEEKGGLGGEAPHFQR